MPYRVEIECDVHVHEHCANHRPFGPVGRGPNAQTAARRAEGDARGKGWVKSKGMRWACGACKGELHQAVQSVRLDLLKKRTSARADANT